MYHIDEENSDIIFEVNGKTVAFKIRGGTSGEGGSKIYLIKEGDPTSPSDKNAFSALRTLIEIAKNALSRLKDDEASGHIKLKQGLTAYSSLTPNQTEINLSEAIFENLSEPDNPEESSLLSISEGITETPSTDEMTLGGLSNVSKEADNAPLGSFLYMGSDYWKPAAPLPGIRDDFENMLIPVWHTVLKEVVFVPASSLGGAVVADTFTITATVNPINVGQCTVTATGDVVSVESPSDKSSFTVKGTKGGNVTVRIVAKDGYKVQTLNVDRVSQGSADSYTFSNLQADHTMYIWMDEAVTEDIMPEFVRSDAPGTVFASLRKAIDSVIVDYPGGLDKDVTVTCTKEGVQHRVNKLDSSSIYNAEIKNFNQGTNYCFIIDGANKLTIDGDSLGGFYIVDSDNLIFRNMVFQNIYTWEKLYSPETFAAIYATSQKDTERNLYIENVTINGQSTVTPSSIYRTFYSVIIKGYRNVNIINSNINKCGWCCVSVRNADVLNISKTYLGGDLRGGMSMHPYILMLSEIRELNVEDCEITAPTFNEYLVSAGNVKNMRFLRNYIHDCKGGFLNCSDGVLINELILSYNYIHSLLLGPLYGWDTQWIGVAGNVNTVRITGNLLKFTTNYYQEFFIRAGGAKVNRLVNANNVFIRKGGNNNGLFLVGAVEELVANNNMYQLISTLFYGIDSGSAAISSSAGRNFEKIKEMGYDINSKIIGTSEKILLSDDGGTRNCLSPVYAAANKCLPEYVDRFDINYKENAPDNSSIGSDNYYSSAFSESADATTGYEGTNYNTAVLFSNAATYTSPGGDLLVLHHKGLIRGKFVKFTVSNASGTHSYMSLGKNAAFKLDVNVDGNGEYLSDNEYSVTIE